MVTYSGRMANSTASLWRTENFLWLHRHCVCSCCEWISGLCSVADASIYGLSFLICEIHGSVFFPCSLYAFHHFVLYIPRCCTCNWIIPLFLIHIISMLMETICGRRLQVLTVIFLSVTPCALLMFWGHVLSAAQSGGFETNRAGKILFMSLLRHYFIFT